MDRYWLLTWTTYGSWLPGDARGFVGNVRDENGMQTIHNIPGTPIDSDMPGLIAYTRLHMKGSTVVLDSAEADALISQYQQIAQIRQWLLCAASVMYNHTHVVLGVPGDPDPQSLLETLKSWATRALKKIRPVPINGTWWTAKGSKRKLGDDTAVNAGVIYTARKQPNPLATYFAPQWQGLIDSFDLASRAP